MRASRAVTSAKQWFQGGDGETTPPFMFPPRGRMSKLLRSAALALGLVFGVAVLWYLRPRPRNRRAPAPAPGQDPLYWGEKPLRGRSQMFTAIDESTAFDSGAWEKMRGMFKGRPVSAPVFTTSFSPDDGIWGDMLREPDMDYAPVSMDDIIKSLHGVSKAIEDRQRTGA